MLSAGFLPEGECIMKRLLICAGLLVAATTSVRSAKARRPARLRRQSATIGGMSITIAYTSPGVKGREGKIFTKDGLISHNPHYPVWRAGANAATTLHTDADIKIGDSPFPRATTPCSWTSPIPTTGCSSSTSRPANGASPTTAPRTWAK